MHVILSFSLVVLFYIVRLSGLLTPSTDILLEGYLVDMLNSTLP
jgi:hypothetical protein